MEDDFLSEEDFDPSLTAAAGSGIAHVQQKINELRKHLKAKTAGNPFQEQLNQIKKQIDQLRPEIPQSDLFDLESQLANMEKAVNELKEQSQVKAPLQPISTTTPPYEFDSLVKTTVNDLPGDLSEAQKDDLEKYCKQFVEGKPLKEIIPLSKDFIEAAYSGLYILYQNGKFSKAQPLFGLFADLTAEYRFYFGCAACLQQVKNYAQAALVFILASCIDFENPYPSYHLCDCQMQMGQFELAKESIQPTINRGSKDPKYAFLSGTGKTRFRDSKQRASKPLTKINELVV